MGNQTLILFCRCAISDAMPRENVEQIAQMLADRHAPHLDVDDLCGVAAALRSTRGVGLPKEFEAFSEVLRKVAKAIIIACEPRAVANLLAWGGITFGGDAHFISLRDASASQKLGDLLKESTFCELGAPPALPPDSWIPWFPVIDYERCIDCRKCLDFCLFSVYDIDDGKVVVRSPQKCKNKCPACARACPVQAVIFPKFGQPPINGGEIVQKSAEAIDSSDPLAAKKHRRRQLFSDDFESKL